MRVLTAKGNFVIAAAGGGKWDYLKWNTGNLYGDEGQIVSAFRDSRDSPIYFEDSTRRVCGLLQNAVEFEADAIMEEYDSLRFDEVKHPFFSDPNYLEGNHDNEK